MHTPTYLIGTLQIKAHRTLQACVAEVLSKSGINASQWFMLGLLHRSSEGLRPGDLAATLQVEAPLVTMLTTPLIAQGLVDKTFHQTDRRAKLLTLTAAGQTFVAATEQTLHRALSSLMHGVTPEQLAAYQFVLERIVANGTGNDTPPAAAAKPLPEGGA